MLGGHFHSRWWRVPLAALLTASAVGYSWAVEHVAPQVVYYNFDTSLSWRIQTALTVTLSLGVSHFFRVWPVVLACIFAAAGGAANLLASFLWDAGVPDYLSFGDTIMNVADLQIGAAFILFALGLPAFYRWWRRLEA